MNIRHFAPALCVTFLALPSPVTASGQTAKTEYLAFQIFCDSRGSGSLTKSFPPLQGKLFDQVAALVQAVGTVGDLHRKLGFVVGPIAFDDTDEQVRQTMREAFSVALKLNVATGFHIDDSMFWDRRADLNKPLNIEWLDWKGAPNTGRRLD